MIKNFVKKIACKVLPERTYSFGVIVYWRWRHKRKTYYERERELLPRFISPNDLVLDIGANLGQYASYMSKLVGPQGKVMAFEALPSTYELGKRIVREQNVDWQNVVLSDSSKAVSMSIVIDALGIINRGLTAVALEGESGRDSVELNASTLDALLASRSKRVSFVKCDVEGHEVQVLKGGREIVSIDKPALLIETCGENFPALMEFLKPIGYKPFLCDSHGHLIPFERPYPDRNFNCFFISSEPGV